VGGNPRYAGKGFKKGDRSKDKSGTQKTITVIMTEQETVQ
jgi:hypothetical protein